jgi:hypothetical protein
MAAKWEWDADASEYRRRFPDGTRGVALLTRRQWEGRLMVGGGITYCGMHRDSRAAKNAVDQAQRKMTNAPTTATTAR